MPGPRRLRGWLAAMVASALLGGGIARAQAPVPEAQLETFLGLTPPIGLDAGDLTNLGYGPVVSGSAIQQTINVSAGATLTFNYDFLTNDAPPPSGGSLNSVINFGFITTPSLNAFVDSTMATMAAPSGTGFLYQTGYQPFTVTFANGGTYALGIGVANVTDDYFLHAGLLLNDIQLTGGTFSNGTTTADLSSFSTIGNLSTRGSDFGISPPTGTTQILISGASVPEPSSVVLMVLGGLGACALVRRRAA